MAKKSLGQHFLTSHTIAKQIGAAGELKKDEIVLEIGPGKGFLTEHLLQYDPQVIALEKDQELIPLLNTTFREAVRKEKLLILEKDVLEFDPSEFCNEKRGYKIVANIPYYITGAIIRKFLESECQPKRMVLLIQKEVADRIVARNKKESLLSISVKAYGAPSIVTKVPARFFKPAPKVDSAVLLIEDISKKLFTEVREEHFFHVVRTGFGHKRKQLKNNLKLVYAPEEIENMYKKLGLDETVRAEDIPLTTWFEIAKLLKESRE